MRANPSKDTKPEVAVRSLLHRQGFRFRKGLLLRVDNVRVRPDIVFTRLRLAVFIDGCYWHSCPQHGHAPRVNTHYWDAKFERNRARDALVTQSLRQAGWSVLRIWEHEAPGRAAAKVARRVDALASRRRT